MALIRWEPSRRSGGELYSLQREFNRLFGTAFDSQTGAAPARRWVPAIDVVEEGERYLLRADLPGLSERDVAIEVSEQILTVSGERGSESEERKQNYYRLERSTGSFSRSIRLPRGIDPEAIEASFANGVLEVSIPKPEQVKPRRVSITPATEAKAVEQASAPQDEAAQSA